MLLHEAVQSNAETLQARDGIGWSQRSESWLGASGAGRMVEPEDIAVRLDALLNLGDLAGLRVLVTAGPTLEDIDPVRFIGNRSTGKWGLPSLNAPAFAVRKSRWLQGLPICRPLPGLSG